jgi:hypothetical protein
MKTQGSAEQPEHRFKRVVELNEAAKVLLSRSFRVNLLALDAMVQSKRGDSSVPGFDEVAAQMLGWSRSLHALLQRLGEASAAVVMGTSAAAKEQHLLRILGSAAELSQERQARAAFALRSAEQDSAAEGLRHGWRRVDELLTDLDQLGMMACVLSRSAMIEACSAGPELRRQLDDVSRDFNVHAQAVVDIISNLLRFMREGKVS